MYVCLQVVKCDWMDWSSKDYTDSLDLDKLESLFGLEDDKSKTTPGTSHANFSYQYVYTHCMYVYVSHSIVHCNMCHSVHSMFHLYVIVCVFQLCVI